MSWQRWRRFDDNDWLIFQGAENFEDGSPPLVLWHGNENGDIAALLCGGVFPRLAIYTFQGEEEVWLMNSSAIPEDGAFAVLALAEDFGDEERWRKLGFLKP